MNEQVRKNCALAAVSLMVRRVNIGHGIIGYIIRNNSDGVAYIINEYPRYHKYKGLSNEAMAYQIKTNYLTMCKLVENNQFRGNQDE